MKRLMCVCGRICRGYGGHASHARACPTEQERSAAFIRAVEANDWEAYNAAWPGSPIREVTS